MYDVVVQPRKQMKPSQTLNSTRLISTLPYRVVIRVSVIFLRHNTSRCYKDYFGFSSSHLYRVHTHIKHPYR